MAIVERTCGLLDVPIDAGGAEEMASNAKDLSNRAEKLNDEINFFKL